MTKSSITILTGAAWLFLGCLCRANTIQAFSTSFVDVSNACHSAAPGDTVLMPPGTNVWFQTLALPAGVSLAGSGSNQTSIACGADANGNIVLIACAALSAAFPTRISNFTIVGTNVENSLDVGCLWMNSSFDGSAATIGHAVPWRIDHLVFNGVPMNNIKVYNVHSGLIDDCVFNITRQFSGQIIRLVNSDSDFSGSYSYSVPYPYGGVNALYVESCFFTNAANYVCGLDDADCGGSLVLRHCISYNCQYNNHGTEGTTFRAQRSFEIYDNTFIANNSACGQNPAMLIRGGTGVIFSNTVVGWKFVETTFVKRVQQWCTTVDGADGLCPFDSNDPVLYGQGVWSGPDGVATNNYTWLTSDITFPNVAWTNNQWAGCTIINTHAPYFFTNDDLAPVYWFGTVVSNTTNTLSVVNPKNGYADQGPQAPNFTLKNGDVYQFHRVLRTLDQIGLGSGDYLAGTNSGWRFYDANVAGGAIPPLANEVSEPLYWWGNTLDGTPADFTNSGFAVIQPNRDYFETPKPDYAPLAYPYPLDGLTNGASGGITNYIPNFAGTNPSSADTSSEASASTGPVTNGLVAWYPLAGDVNDYSGNGNDGALVGAPGYVNGPNGSGGTAIAFAGSSQCVTIPASPSIALTSNLTITAWVYFKSTAYRNEIVTKGVSGANNGLPAAFELYQGNDNNPGNIGLAVGNGVTADSGNFAKIVSGSLTTNAWYFVAATLAGNVASLYTNGVLSASRTLSADCADGGGNVMIGDNNQNWYPMKGSVAQVRLFNRALSPDEIESVYTSDLSSNALPQSLTAGGSLTPPSNLRVK